MGLVKIFSFMLIMYVFISAPKYTEGAVTCSMVTQDLSPCVEYLTRGGSVPAPCCGGVRALSKALQTSADRKAACGCIKSLAGVVSGISFGYAGALPKKCGVKVPYPISPNTDCSKVH